MPLVGLSQKGDWLRARIAFSKEFCPVARCLSPFLRQSHQRIKEQPVTKRSTTERRQAEFNRRTWLRLAAAGFAASSSSGWIETLAAQTGTHPDRQRSCILLWMNGGPSQLDTFDLKPDHENGGEFQPIDTAVPGIQISEHLPKLAGQMKEMAILRSMSTQEGDHGRAMFHLHTGYMPQGQIQYPTLGALVAKEREDRERELPGFVSIAPFRQLNPAAYSPGFLGHEFAPLIVGERQNIGAPGDAAQDLMVKDLNLAAGTSTTRAGSRLDLLGDLNGDFLNDRPGLLPGGHRLAYERAVTLMNSESVRAFELEGEPARLRDAYGRNGFGQGCLLARRLVERGVPFVEVSLNSTGGNSGIGWDTHQNNFEGVKQLSEVLDPAFATLIEDLRDRGLLDSTLIVWMGEFGRTPKINGQGGRDHFPNAWSTVLAGGGIKGGQVIGQTSEDGTRAIERPIRVPDFLATISMALGISPGTENISNLGRPIRVVDRDARPVREVLA